ncbi:MAG: hypothetical protein Q9163_004319 [Psora crenata]
MIEQLAGAGGSCEIAFVKVMLRRATIEEKEKLETYTCDAKMPMEEATIDEEWDSDDMWQESDDDDDDSNDDDDKKSVSHASPDDEKAKFSRVDVTTKLVSRRSLLTLQIQEGKQAPAPYAIPQPPTANQQCGAPVRKTDLPQTPQDPSEPLLPALTTGKPPPPVLCPWVLCSRSTRRNMFFSEMTTSVKKCLLCERRVKSATIRAVLKRKCIPGDDGSQRTSGSQDEEDSGNDDYLIDLPAYYLTGW